MKMMQNSFQAQKNELERKHKEEIEKIKNDNIKEAQEELNELMKRSLKKDNTQIFFKL